MSQLVLSFIRRLRRAVSIGGLTDRCVVRLPLSVSLTDLRPTGGGARRSCSGFTCDLSRTGLSFVLPMVRFGNYHIFSEGGSALRIKLELPDGPIELKARPVRYDLIAEHEEVQGYVIGAHILEVSERDQTLYLQFLRTPVRNPQAAGRAKASNPASALPHAG